MIARGLRVVKRGAQLAGWKVEVGCATGLAAATKTGTRSCAGYIACSVAQRLALAGPWNTRPAAMARRVLGMSSRVAKAASTKTPTTTIASVIESTQRCTGCRRGEGKRL